MRKFHLAVLVLAFLIIPSSYVVYAKAPPPPTPTGQVDYFTVSGGSCTSTVWSTTASDGNVPAFFPNNVGGPPLTAQVNSGQDICITLVLKGASPSTTYYFAVDHTSPVGSFTTDSSGDGSGSIVWTNSVVGSGTSVCTIPIFWGTNNPPNVHGTQANHLVLATSQGSVCSGPPTSVPEFPYGSLLMIGLAAPLLLVARRSTRVG
jgi:hypothetical protein